MDRMEIIRIAGYTEDEKLEIAAGTCCPRRSVITLKEGSSRSPTRRCFRSSGPIPAKPACVTSSAN
jgi:hypothetical protein